ncbi:PilC/PilY family type IV pilus protein [uncultured Endozoicomonas sp.]|uniref:pilus assembly protein n=1 Tax=uncultured Endozoicomonas sp. TaxID=432652 RepID=UPI0026340B05|nr:PilC/PilY family type IV pilus protein [uncultured Endozoicomonas sp.]
MQSISWSAARQYVATVKGVNLSLMTQNTKNGGHVGNFSMNVANARQSLLNTLSHWVAGTGADHAPITETLFEAHRYLTGSSLLWGLPSMAGSFETVSSRYISPIQHQCQDTSLIYMMAGRPGEIEDNDADGAIRSLTSASCGLTIGSSLTLGSCFDELASLMNNSDLRSTIPGTQNASVNVISLTSGSETEISSAAANGGGRYLQATNVNDIVDRLHLITNDALSSSADAIGTSFTQPVTSISADSIFRNAEDVYYALFQPVNGAGWTGNLKRYRIGTDNQLYDALGVIAIDPATGFFNTGIQSIWSSSADGNRINQGGMAENLSQHRPVFTYLGSNTLLSHGSNRLNESNSLITAGMLGVGSAAQTRNTLRWARGIDVDDEDGDTSTTDDRTTMGDPLHTQPKAITYFKDVSTAGTTVDKTVYLTTNDGFLHGVNAENGETEFSFIPRELLPNLAIYKDEPPRFPPGVVFDTNLISRASWNLNNPWGYSISRSGASIFFTGTHGASATQTLRLQNTGVYVLSFNTLGPSGANTAMNWSVQNPVGNIVASGGFNNIPGSANGRVITFQARSTGNYTVTFRDNTPLVGAPSLSGVGLWQLFNLSLEAPSARNDHLAINYKIFGMDGPMTEWVNDVNGDGDILQSNNGTADPGEHAYLYLTMRRGGRSIYALDVTNRQRPRFKWQINGGTGSFSNLGQTWSKPQIVTVNWDGSPRKVLMFGGGYDPVVDGHTTVINGRFGHSIFMVDAETGSLLWKASNSGSNLNLSNMVHGIAADITPLDLNDDQLIDVIYAVDVGGQIFRVDINQNNTGSNNFAYGGRIAELSAGSAANARRFFQPVTVAFGGGRDHMFLAVGSGNRTSPTSTSVNDRIYVIRDPNIDKPVNYGYNSGYVIRESELYDATSNLIQQGTAPQRDSALQTLKNKHGWFIRLTDAGEKVLGGATIYNSILFVNTFRPNSAAMCSDRSGTNFSYALNIENGGARFNHDGTGSTSALIKSDRRKALTQSSIAPSPALISSGPKGAELCIGTECFVDYIRRAGAAPIHKLFWREF